MTPPDKAAVYYEWLYLFFVMPLRAIKDSEPSSQRTFRGPNVQYGTLSSEEKKQKQKTQKGLL